MKIKYEFATGEKTEVEVSDELDEVMVDLDRHEHNNEHKETRRHTSLDSMDYEGEFFADSTDLLDDVLRNETTAMVREAVSKLKPKQQELIYALYLSPKPLSQSEYAAKLGISEHSIKQNAWRARMRLREIIENSKNS